MIIESGVIIFVGLMFMFIKLPRKISLWLLGHSLELDLSVSVLAYALHFGTFTGVIADLQVQLFRAVQADDLETARRIADRIWPTAEVFYSEPWVDMHSRMKEALVLLGKLHRAVVRPPLTKLPAAEIQRIRRALVEAGLLEEQTATRRTA